jgi:hypothetical protein
MYKILNTDEDGGCVVCIVGARQSPRSPSGLPLHRQHNYMLNSVDGIAHSLLGYGLYDLRIRV